MNVCTLSVLESLRSEEALGKDTLQLLVRPKIDQMQVGCAVPKPTRTSTGQGSTQVDEQWQRQCRASGSAIASLTHVLDYVDCLYVSW